MTFFLSGVCSLLLINLTPKFKVTKDELNLFLCDFVVKLSL